MLIEKKNQSIHNYFIDKVRKKREREKERERKRLRSLIKFNNTTNLLIY